MNNTLEIKVKQSTKNALLPLSLADLNLEGHTSERNMQIPVGTFLTKGETKIFQVIDCKDVSASKHTYSLPLLKNLVEIEKDELFSLSPVKEGYSLAIVTLSDKGYQGNREDTSGELIHQIMQQALPLSFINHYMLPDNPTRLKALVSKLALENQYDIIITTGGTGIAPTDLTPEAIIPLLTRRFHGFEQAMMAASFQKTPNALISRAFVGTIEKTFIVALQGSPKAVRENLEVIMPALPHTLDKLNGSTIDCATL